MELPVICVHSPLNKASLNIVKKVMFELGPDEFQPLMKNGSPFA